MARWRRDMTILSTVPIPSHKYFGPYNSCIWAHDFQPQKAQFDIRVKFIRFPNSKVVWTQLNFTRPGGQQLTLQNTGCNVFWLGQRGMTWDCLNRVVDKNVSVWRN
jgi:hypothetical protein